MPAKKRRSKKAHYEVKVGRAPVGTGYELRGDCRLFFSSREHEVMLSGPSDTGKTWVSCIKAHVICSLIPKAQGAIMRKTYNSLSGTVVKTFERIIAGSGVRIFGGESPSRFIYPNGSCIWLGGMDNPAKALSSERDFIYPNQAEEFTLNDWEILSSRCSGRGAVVADPQIFGDCNPGGSKHWIRARAAEGKLRLLVATHRDNPTLFDEHGVLTEDGAKRIAVLEAMSGVRRKRLYEGIWATAEGAVFDTFDVNVHRHTRDPREMKRWWLCEDEGFTNPSVILLVGADSDGRWHVFKEFYQRNIVPENVQAVALEWYPEPQRIAGMTMTELDPRLVMRCELDAVDDAAAGMIASRKSAGINARGGKGRILDGVAALQDRLKVQGDGRPRFTVDPSCVETINEFESHVWRPEKDVPVDADNHAVAALRYLNDVLAEPTGVFKPGDVKKAQTGHEPKAGDPVKSFTPEQPGARFVPRTFTPRR